MLRRFDHLFSFELDEDIVCVKRVKISWYENDLSSKHGGIFIRWRRRNLKILIFFSGSLEL
jgi:hypothetical protein